MVMVDKFIVFEKDVYSFIICCLEVIGINMEYVKVLVDVLICVDMRGIYSYGLSRIGKVMVNLYFYSIVLSSLKMYFFKI